MMLRIAIKNGCLATGFGLLLSLANPVDVQGDAHTPVRFARQTLPQEAPLMEPLTPGQATPTIDGIQLPVPRLEIDVQPTPGTLPKNVGLDYVRSQGVLQGDVGPRWYLSPYYWEAAALFHRPLYFEDAALERHGRSRFAALQPGISAVRAAGQFVILPGQMIIHRPLDCDYTYGFGKPRVAPVYPFPWCSPLLHNPYANYPMHPVEPAAPADVKMTP